MNNIAHLLLRRMAGILTADEARRLDEWIGQSDEHRQLAERLTDGAAVMDELGRRAMVETRRPLEDMRRRIAASRRRTLMVRLRWVAAACVALMVVAGSVLMLDRKDPATQAPVVAAVVTPGYSQATVTLPDGSQRSVATRQELAEALAQGSADAGIDLRAMPLQLDVPRGGEFHIVLEDSTEVWLNAESRLVCDAAFGGTERRVMVEGEAYFKVAKDANRPFLVESEGQTVRVYGTEFNVRSYADDAVRTTLVEGSIALRRTGTTGELMLAPGQQSVLADGEATVRTVKTDVVTSWRHGRFVFEDQALEQIMADLARWYDFEYEFADDALRHIVFMGSIPRYAKFETALAILGATGNICLTPAAEAEGGRPKFIIKTQAK